MLAKMYWFEALVISICSNANSILFSSLINIKFIQKEYE